MTRWHPLPITLITPKQSMFNNESVLLLDGVSPCHHGNIDGYSYEYPP